MNLDANLAIEIVYALGIGVLVGLERSFHTRVEEARAAAEPGQAPRPDDDIDDEALEPIGVRTFAVLSIFGFGAALVGEQHPFVPPVALMGAIAMVVAFYFRSSQQGIGITTEMAAIATCLLGMMCRSHHQLAGVLALVVTVLLASKRFTHSTVRKVRRVELYDTLKFLAFLLIVLPLLPNRVLDPLGAFNPYKVGVLVVLISGIGFAGYFLTRLLGARRGLGLAGVVGGLTSSTAVTAAMAAQAKSQPQLRTICAFSTVAANATMFGRVLVVVALLDMTLFLRLSWALGAMTATALAATGLLWLRAKSADARDASAEVPLKNPFSIAPALKFAAFFVFILVVLQLAKTHLGAQGLYAAAALSGLADVDAITLSVAEQTRGASLTRDVGGLAIIIAVVANSATKTGIAIYSGGWGFGRLVAAALGAATLVGLGVAIAL